MTRQLKTFSGFSFARPFSCGATVRRSFPSAVCSTLDEESRSMFNVLGILIFHLSALIIVCSYHWVIHYTYSVSKRPGSRTNGFLHRCRCHWLYLPIHISHYILVAIVRHLVDPRSLAVTSDYRDQRLAAEDCHEIHGGTAWWSSSIARGFSLSRQRPLPSFCSSVSMWFQFWVVNWRNSSWHGAITLHRMFAVQFNAMRNSTEKGHFRITQGVLLYAL